MLLNFASTMPLGGGMHYATSRKVAGSILDEVIGYFSIDLILPAAIGPGVYSASNRNEYQELIK
jgi:hypothetical protein